VQARDLAVPVERDVGGRPAPEGQPLAVFLEREDPVLTVAVAEDQEGQAPALGVELRLELGGGRRLWSRDRVRDWVIVLTDLSSRSSASGLG
jgi:hypothetical protein